MIQISTFDFDLRREPLLRPFAFKGGAFTEKWLTQISLQNVDGDRASGLAGIAVLWSDPQVFFSHSETGGNLLMALMAEHGAQLLVGQSHQDPLAATKSILESVHAFGRRITGCENLRRTFALNALVAVDSALWRLHAAQQGITRFDDLIPTSTGNILGARQERLIRLPAITYKSDDAEIASFAEKRNFLPKIKIGHPGNPEEMLAKDTARLRRIHELLANCPADYSDSGKLLYYLDANGRYENPEMLLRLLTGLDDDMCSRILLIEEPFPEEKNHDVGNFPIPIAADESLHGAEDVRRRASQGYSVMTLKVAGKTLSMTFEMAAEAQRLGLPCIVADSSCIPELVGWNQVVAARLAPLPGMKCGILESNGPESYRNWKSLVATHPHCGAPWLEAKHGVFELDESFYACSAGILDTAIPSPDA